MERLRKRVAVAEPDEENNQDPDNICAHCKKRFSRADSLNDHIKAIHEKKTIRCAVCSKTLSSLQKLRRHQLTHTDEKQHQCSHCMKSFKREDALTYHVNTIHKINQNAKPLSIASKCEFCLRYECPRHHLISVIRCARPYVYHQCTVCLKITSNCELHWRHQHLEHSDDDDVTYQMGHQCDTCQRVFTSFKALKRHSGGKCFTLNNSEPLRSSGAQCITDAEMQEWIKKQLAEKET